MHLVELPCETVKNGKRKNYFETIQIKAKFQTLMMLCLIFIIDHRFQQPQQSLNCKALTHHVITQPTRSYGKSKVYIPSLYVGRSQSNPLIVTRISDP